MDKVGYYNKNELSELGLKGFGTNVLISKDCRIYNPSKLKIANNVRIDDFCILTGEIELGNFVHIGAFSLLSGRAGIEMKDFTALSSHVSLYSVNEDYSNGSSLTNPTVPESLRKIEQGKIILEKHSLIGANSIVLPSSHIKTGVVIGANSVVKGECEEWNLYAGSPVKKIRKRPKEQILADEKKLLT